MLLYSGIALLLVVLVLQIGILRAISNLLQKSRYLEERTNKSSELFTMLTEACAGGFASMAEELTRVADQTPQARRTPVSSSKLKRAAGRGQPIHEIAAAEQLAEGEVRLRLFLENARAAAKESINGTLRAS